MGETRPNILVINADDMRADDLQFMPKTTRLLGDQGTTFKNAFVTYPACCPSRATLQRGQYPHNHRVRFTSPPLGGYEVFYERGHESSTVGTWLDAAGYTTYYLGKYMNGYEEAVRTADVPLKHVPAGWDKWAGRLGYLILNINGEIKRYPAGTYHDQVLKDRVINFFKVRGPDAAPFFVVMSPQAPHQPATPHPAYEDRFSDLRVPRDAAYNEADVSDKPDLRQLPPLTQDLEVEMNQLYRNRARTLAALDDYVAQMVRTLAETGDLENTYIFFTSDNGYHMGEHRQPNTKGTAYEEDIRVPLLVRGPGVPVATRERLVINNDLAPTFADLGGGTTPDFVDGRSLVPLLDESGANDGPVRKGFEVRLWGEGTGLPSYSAVRTERHLYVEYEDGSRELYDLQEDPEQLQNIYDAQGTSATLKEDLVGRLRKLEACAGETCREAEN